MMRPVKLLFLSVACLLLAVGAILIVRSRSRPDVAVDSSETSLSRRMAEEERKTRTAIAIAQPQTTVSDTRNDIKSALKDQEPVYEGKPTSYWVKQMRDRSWRTRSEAARVLGVLGADNTDVIAELVHELENVDPTDTECAARRTSVEAIGIIASHSDHAVGALVKRLADEREDQIVRVAAARAVGKIGRATPDVIDALLKALMTGDPGKRSSGRGVRTGDNIHVAAIDTVQSLRANSPAVVSALANAIDSKDIHVQISAAKALDQIAAGTWEKEVTTRLLARLRSPDAGVRRGTIMAIDRQDAGFDSTRLMSREEAVVRLNRSLSAKLRTDPTILSELAKAISDDDYGIRIAAEKCLNRIDPDFMESTRSGFLLAQLRNENGLVRFNTLKELQNRPTRDQEVIRRLFEIMTGDADFAVRGEANRAIQAQPLALTLSLGLASENPGVRREMISRLGRATRQELKLSVECLATALRDVDGSIRWESLQLLRRLGRDAMPAVPALKGCLDDKDYGIRLQAIEALIGIDPSLRDLSSPRTGETEADVIKRLKAADVGNVN